MNQKVLTAGWLFAILLFLDLVTKSWALKVLPDRSTIDAFGGLVPLTLTFNTGVAFGISVGEMRWLIVGGTVLVICALGVLFHQARADDQLRIYSLAAVMAGAMGNLIDRVRWERGVVDFIGPFPLGFADFPIFNVADMAITFGAIALAASLWLEERQAELEPAAAVEAASTEAA